MGHTIKPKNHKLLFRTAAYQSASTWSCCDRRDAAVSQLLNKPTQYYTAGFHQVYKGLNGDSKMRKIVLLWAFHQLSQLRYRNCFTLASNWMSCNPVFIFQQVWEIWKIISKISSNLVPWAYYMYYGLCIRLQMSRITRKCVFEHFWPGMTQTGLLSYSD